MKKYLSIILVNLLCICSYSQSISVSSFKLLESDLTANTAGTTERDQNGEVAALIKVVTTQTGFTFDCGSMGIVKTVQKPAEIWVYVPHGVKKMTISHPQLGLLRDYYLNIPIEKARTYEMVLVSGTVQTIVQQARTSQFVIFQLSPANAQVELDGNVLETVDGTATKMMKFGTYNYRVQAPNYLPEAGNVTIDDPKNKKIINISLKPNFSRITVKVDNNAEIWINGTKKGNGSWTGNLGKGTYEFEAKKDGHRSTLANKDIMVTDAPQTITLQAPTPIYGEAEINSKPAMADIYIDGKKYGQTPTVISDLITGSHQIRITKSGYNDYRTNITIKERETTSVNAQLDKIVASYQTSTPAATPSSANSADAKVHDVVEQMPSFGGGEYMVTYTDEKGNTHQEKKVCPPGQAGLFQWLAYNVKYPAVAEEHGIQGRVIVTFVVERDGSITEVKVVKSVDPSLDAEAVRVTKSMPKWISGKQNGSAVRVKYTLPITFRL